MKPIMLAVLSVLALLCGVAGVYFVSLALFGQTAATGCALLAGCGALLVLEWRLG